MSRGNQIRPEVFSLRASQLDTSSGPSPRDFKAFIKISIPRPLSYARTLGTNWNFHKVFDSWNPRSSKHFTSNTYCPSDNDSLSDDEEIVPIDPMTCPISINTDLRARVARSPYALGRCGESPTSSSKAQTTISASAKSQPLLYPDLRLWINRDMFE